jgi:hypothetical protein
MDGERMRKADRALDTEVAIKVMGWKRGRLYGNGNGEWIIPQRDNENDPLTWDQTPAFSAKIETAWRVVEKLQEQHTIKLNDCTLDGDAGWVCSLDGEDIGEVALTAPLAICLAALKAQAQHVLDGKEE